MVDLKNKKKIHFIGIGGIGMSAIAEILLSRGYEITGSDMNEGQVLENLKNKGIKVFIGHNEKNITDQDLIVYTAAVSYENPEIVRGKEKGILIVSRAEILGELMALCNNSIAVAGTHGKTTTTSMLAIMLQKANLDPTLLVGGNLAEINGNVRIGEGSYLLTEACEYMDSFLSMKPKYEIILNIDSDHLDYFRDIDHISESFRKFAKLVPSDGKIIAYSANPFVNSAVKDMNNIVTFGLTQGCDYWADNISFNHDGVASYNLYRRDENLGKIHMNMPGEYNVLNSLAAIACADTLGISLDVAKETLKEYSGTQRRFDFLGTTSKGVKIIDDYAHHPTEIKEALKATRNIKKNKLWCVFQPHTYTRTIALFHDFARSFDDADAIIMAEIYPAREKNIHKISSKALAEKISDNYPNKSVRFFKDFDEIKDFLNSSTKENDLVLTMGAGDVYKIGEMLLEDE